MTKGKIYVVGTSHIAKQSISKTKDIYDKKDPEIIAVELDQNRLLALLHNQKPDLHISNLFRIGLTGYLFMLIGSFVQRKLGKIVGLQPGSDMLYASKLALKNQKRLLLIDQDIRITLRRLSKYFSAKEKFRMIADIFKSFFVRNQLQLDLTTVPEEKIIEKILVQVKKRYPNAYKVLIQERNQHMADQIVKAHKANPESNIMVVVGAGHKQDLIKILRKRLNAKNI